MKILLFVLVLLPAINLANACSGRYNTQSPPSTTEVSSKQDTTLKQDTAPKQDTTPKQEQTTNGGNSAELQNGIHVAQAVNYHNQLRRGEGSSDMQLMDRDEELSGYANELTKSCHFEHDNDGYGQNMYYTTASEFSPISGIRTWFNEKKDYTYDTNSCASGKACGHYTQVVWAESTKVGCAVTKCAQLNRTSGKAVTNAWFFVCNYTPRGNIEGEKPFKKGEACTKCLNSKNKCKNELCNGFCKDCLACENTHRYCGRNPGWPAAWCTRTYAFVLSSCPKMCGLC